MRSLQVSRKGIYKALLLAGGASTFAFAAPAMAQEAGAPDADVVGASADQGQAIVVTGSRIVRRDFEANSPITSVDEALLEQSSTSAIEQNLNKLPQFTPAQTPTLGGDIQPNARSTPGAATIALRGIGANRNLVLIDGRRATPSNATGVVDINTIPPAAIERVEIITGGASSTYGADAVGGVVNFILKKNFVGLELDAQMGITERGDNFEYQVSGIMGTDFDDGRGNVNISFAMNDRNRAFQRDRDWYRDLWADPTVGGTSFFPPFGGVNLGFGNLPTAAALNANINGATFTDTPQNLTVYSDFDGNAFTGFGATGVPGASGFTGIDDFQFKRLVNGQIGSNNIENFLVLPMTRYNIYGRGDYEINDWIGVFAQGYFSKVSTTTVQEAGPITSGWAVLVDPTINREVIPTELLNILDSRPDPNAPFQMQGLLPFNRGSESEVWTYNMTAGIQGPLSFLGDWTYEVFGSRGETLTTVSQTGFASLQRLQAVLSEPNFGRGFSRTGNQGPPNFGFGAATATCTSGLNLFQPETITQDCFDAISADIRTKATMEQTIWEANVQGGLFELPAGEIRTAMGVSHRTNDYRFLNDTLVQQGSSFIEQALGLYPAGDSEGKIKAQEAYGELLVPILADLPAIQRLELELGARYSDYNTTGGSWTYKILGDWEVTDFLRIRGGYNRAERAPNIAELFLASEQTFASAVGGDVCSINNQLGYSANPNANPDFRQALAICGALMEASGDVNADTSYYGVDYRQLIAADSADAVRALVTNPQATGAAFVFPTLTGNPNLAPEVADTWTAGAVLRSPFTNPLVSNLRLAVDYYSIKIKDVIQDTSVDFVQQRCFDPQFNPTLDPNFAFCDPVNRNASGALGNVIRSFDNLGSLKTSGIDVQLDWAFDVGPGQVSLNSVFNYLIDYKQSDLAGVLPALEYAGTANWYDYKAFTTLGYSVGGARLALQWRHLSSRDASESVRNPNTPILGVGSYDLFNLNGTYQMFDNMSIRFGVDNLFDKRPPITGRNPAALLPNLPGGSFDAQNYDTIGRRFYMGMNVDF